jgi:hypothetical protein
MTRFGLIPALILIAGLTTPARSAEPVPGTHFDIPQGLPTDLAERMGPEQRERELIETSLLNRFGGMGFAQMRGLIKQGDLYYAEVKSVEGIWIKVIVDPDSGAVTIHH